MDFYAYQEAAYVSIDGSSDGLDFELSTYYCTIDWEPVPSPLKYGYVLGCWEWVGERPMWPKYSGGITMAITALHVLIMSLAVPMNFGRLRLLVGVVRILLLVLPCP